MKKVKQMDWEDFIKLIKSLCNLAKLCLREYPTTFTPAQYEEWISQARQEVKK